MKVSKECKFCKKEMLLYKSKLNDCTYCSKECAYKDTHITKICQHCKKEFEVHNCRKDKRVYCSIDCRNKEKIGKPYLSKRRYYRCINIDGNRIDYHRYIMQQHLGRKLLTTEHIHHIDHNPLNNSIDNLMVLSLQQHSRLHNLEPEKHKECTCPCCNKKFINTQSRERIYCSQSCSTTTRNKTGKFYNKINKECTCKQCNKNFSNNRNRERKFCSKSCATIFKNTLRKENNTLLI